MITLEVIAGPQAGATFRCTRDRIIVGRAEHTQVRLLDPEISREHAAIALDGDVWVLQDLGAINPVKVNGIVQTKCVLKAGDILQLGYNELRFDPGISAVKRAIRGNVSRFDITTWVAVTGLVLLQVGFLVVVSVAWRGGNLAVATVNDANDSGRENMAKLMVPVPEDKASTVSDKSTAPDKNDQLSPSVSVPANTMKPGVEKVVDSEAETGGVTMVLIPESGKTPEIIVDSGGETSGTNPANAGEKPSGVNSQAVVNEGVANTNPVMENTLSPAGITPARPEVVVIPADELAVVKTPEAMPPVVPPPHLPTPGIDPVVSENPVVSEEQLLDMAQKEIERGNLFGADIHLVDLLRRDPGFLAAYAERARLFEKRALFPQAIEQWDEIVKRGENSNWTRIAREEQTRLQKVQNLLADAERLQAERRNMNAAAVVAPPFDPAQRAPLPPPPEAFALPLPPAPPPPAVVTLPPQPEPLPSFPPLKLMTHGMERMPQSSPDLEDMRMLTMVLQVDERLATVRGEDVQLKLTFFDRDRSTRRVEVSSVQNPGALSRLSGVLRGGEKITLTRHYAATVELRRKQQASNKAMAFYGYRIEIYHRNRLVASVSEPDALN